VPEQVFEISLEELNLPARIHSILVSEYKTAGDLMLQMKFDSDKILGLNGIGPKSLEEIEVSINSLAIPGVVEEPIVEPEIEVSEPEAKPVTEVPEFIEKISEVEIEPEEELVSVEYAAQAEREAIVLSVESAEESPLEDVETTATDVVDHTSVEATGEEPRATPDVVAKEVEEGEGEAPATFDALFTLKPETITYPDDLVEEEDEEGPEKRSKKKKKKRKKYVEMEYDPERDAVIVKRKRKRGGEDWEEGWNL
jgi:N utilization substance protein A